MQHLEVSGALRPIYASLGFKGKIYNVSRLYQWLMNKYKYRALAE